MRQIVALYENETIIEFGNIRTFFINSVKGRAKLLTACRDNNCEDLIDEIYSVWGEKPTVIDEPSVLTFYEAKKQKKAEIAAARYARETAGVTANGITIDTERDSQALITGAALAAMLDENYSLNWKTESGFIHLTAPEIIAVAQAVRVHVQACFDREAELCALVDAAETPEDLDEIIISWPI